VRVFVDHVVHVVRDLDATTDSLRRAGFTIKPGRLHANGLLNAHVKFRTAQEVEYMTLAAEPGDSMAIRYRRLLDDAEGPAYLALAAADPARVAPLADSVGLRASAGSQFVSFPHDSAAMAVFFSARSTVFDPDSLLTHANGANGIHEVVVEGGEALGRLLLALGAAYWGAAEALGRQGRRFALANADVVVIRPTPGRRPRLQAVTLSFDR
jgi:hypothetical protein